MNLTATTQSLELVTSSAFAVTWAVSWTDIDKTGVTIATPGSNQGTVSAVTTTIIVPPPASATIYRIVTGITLLATGGAQTVAVQKDVAGTDYPVARAVLAINEALCFEDADGWYSLTALGERKGAGTPGAPGTPGINGGGTVLGSGTSIVNFGSGGSSHTTLNVIGQPAILAGSLVYAWVKPEATLDHSAEEHVVEDIRVYAASIIAGVGFTIHAVAGNEIISASTEARLARFSGVGQDAGPGQRQRGPQPAPGGLANLVFGRWSVGWLYTQ